VAGFLRERAGVLNVSPAKMRGGEGWGVVLTLDTGHPDRRGAARAADRLRVALAEALEREGVDAGSLPAWTSRPYDPGASVRRARPALAKREDAR